MSSFSFLISSNDHNPVIKADLVAINMLATQLAANVIATIPDMPVDEYLVPVAGAGQVLEDAVNWAPHGYTNAFQSQVEFLYGFVQMVVDGSYPGYMLEKQAAILIAKALDEYQAHKTAICDRGKEINGPNWGTGTGFYKAVWNDLNDKFLSRYGAASR